MRCSHMDVRGRGGVRKGRTSYLCITRGIMGFITLATYEFRYISSAFLRRAIETMYVALLSEAASELQPHYDFESGSVVAAIGMIE